MSHALRPMALRLLRPLPPLAYSMAVHALYQRRFSTFRNPRTFTELLVAKKLRDHDPLYPITVDKLLARDYVAERVSEEHLVPLVAAVDDPREIPFDDLPEACVIKARHGYAMNLLLRAGEPVDREAIIRTTTEWLGRGFYANWKEWAYRECRRGLVIEHMLGDGVTPPCDIKCYVFNGRTGMIQYDSDRFSGHKVNLYDRNWRPITAKVGFPQVEPPPGPPSNLDLVLEVAEAIAVDLEFARIDLYSVDEKVYFGEITHYPGAGCVKHDPWEFDLALGELWRNGTPLPERFLGPAPAVVPG